MGSLVDFKSLGNQCWEGLWGAHQRDQAAVEHLAWSTHYIQIKFHIEGSLCRCVVLSLSFRTGDSRRFSLSIAVLDRIFSFMVSHAKHLARLPAEDIIHSFWCWLDPHSLLSRVTLQLEETICSEIRDFIPELWCHQHALYRTQFCGWVACWPALQS